MTICIAGRIGHAIKFSLLGTVEGMVLGAAYGTATGVSKRMSGRRCQRHEHRCGAIRHSGVREAKGAVMGAFVGIVIGAVKSTAMGEAEAAVISDAEAASKGACEGPVMSNL